MIGMNRVLLALLVVTFLVAMSAEGAVPSTPGVSQAWAFEGRASGTQNSVPLTGLQSTHYHVLIVSITEEKNASNNISEVTLFWAVQAIFFADYATPGGQIQVNLSAETTEAMVAHENVTWAGSMTRQGIDVTALALLNSTVRFMGNTTVLSIRDFAANGAAPPRLTSAYLSDSLTARYSLDLSSPLGLIPLDPLAGHQWTSKANFNLAGSYQGSYHYMIQAGFNGSAPLSGSGDPSGALSPASGDLMALARTTGTTNLSGLGVYGVEVTLPGSSFVLVDGVIVPYAVDSLTPGAESWWLPPELPGVESLVTDQLLLAMPGSGGPGILGADETFNASLELPSPAHGAIASTAPVQSSEIVCTPISPSTAMVDYGALATSLSQGPRPGNGGYSLLDWVLVGTVATAAVVGGVIGGVRRLGRKATGSHSRFVRSPAPPSSPGPSGVEIPQDPLEHLW